jgi:hypothetical protein
MYTYAAFMRAAGGGDGGGSCKGATHGRKEAISSTMDSDGLLGGSYLFKEIKKRTPKSRETIPLRIRDITKSYRNFCSLCSFHIVNRESSSGRIRSFLIGSGTDSGCQRQRIDCDKKPMAEINIFIIIIRRLKKIGEAV